MLKKDDTMKLIQISILCFLVVLGCTPPGKNFLVKTKNGYEKKHELRIEDLEVLINGGYRKYDSLYRLIIHIEIDNNGNMPIGLNVDSLKLLSRNYQVQFDRFRAFDMSHQKELLGTENGSISVDSKSQVNSTFYFLANTLTNDERDLVKSEVLQLFIEFENGSESTQLGPIELIPESAS